jgi:hypothetical protein
VLELPIRTSPAYSPATIRSLWRGCLFLVGLLQSCTSGAPWPVALFWAFIPYEVLNEQPCHPRIPVAGLFILARPDSQKVAGESGARMARGLAARGRLTHPWPSVSRTRRVACLQVRLCWLTTLYGLMLALAPRKRPQVVFRGATDPSTGRRRRFPSRREQQY